jgi:hypothetical protein
VAFAGTHNALVVAKKRSANAIDSAGSCFRAVGNAALTHDQQNPAVARLGGERRK